MKDLEVLNQSLFTFIKNYKTIYKYLYTFIQNQVFGKTKERLKAADWSITKAI